MGSFFISVAAQGLTAFFISFGNSDLVCAYKSQSDTITVHNVNENVNKNIFLGDYALSSMGTAGEIMP